LAILSADAAQTSWLNCAVVLDRAIGVARARRFLLAPTNKEDKKKEDKKGRYNTRSQSCTHDEQETYPRKPLAASEVEPAVLKGPGACAVLQTAGRSVLRVGRAA